MGASRQCILLVRPASLPSIGRCETGGRRRRAAQGGGGARAERGACHRRHGNHAQLIIPDCVALAARAACASRPPPAARRRGRTFYYIPANDTHLRPTSAIPKKFPATSTAQHSGNPKVWNPKKRAIFNGYNLEKSYLTFNLSHDNVCLFKTQKSRVDFRC